MENFDGLDSFLTKVDELDSIVRGLSSDDPRQVQVSMNKADQIIKGGDDETHVDGIKTRTKLNRTVINKYGENDQAPGFMPPANMNQEAFMAVMEQDAQERHQRKQEARKVANGLKDQGNEAFKSGNVQRAVELYSEALKHIRDMTVIYTNRAQAYIKLGKFQEAIGDCDWALRVDEKCLKALIHKGRAHTYLKEFDKALEQFEQAKQMEPKQTPLIEDYIREMERCRKAHHEEEALNSFLSASSESSNEKKDVIETLKDILATKIYKKDQSLIYYAGGLRLIGNLCDDVTKKTFFRVQNGFVIFQEHPVIAKYFKAESVKATLGVEELQLLSSVFEMLQSICQDCDENIKSLFAVEGFSDRVLTYLSLHLSSNAGRKFQIEILRFLLQESKSEFGLLKLTDGFDLDRFLETLIVVSLYPESKTTMNESRLIRSLSTQILLTCSLNARFLKKLRPENVDVFARNLVDFLRKLPVLGDDVKFNVVTVLYGLTSESAFRASMAETEDLWKMGIEMLTDCIPGLGQANEVQRELFNNLCCLFINLTSTPSPALDSHGEQLTKKAIEASNTGQVMDKPLALLGNILQRGANKAELVKLLDKPFILKLISNVQAQKSEQQSVKLLAICTQLDSTTNRSIITKKDKSLSFLYGLFRNVSQDYAEDSKVNIKSLNESLLNNAILCMSHCVDSHASVARSLTDENIIMDLVYLTRDGRNKELQKNCGILVAKLCKQDNKHLERLRELHGIEILHSALKNTEI